MKYMNFLLPLSLLFVFGCSGGGSGSGSGDSASVAANVILGQQTNPLRKGFNSVGKPVIAGSKLIVPDLGNNRVLIWNSIPTSNNQQPDVVVGQDSLFSNGANQGLYAPGANSLSGPVAASSNGTNLLVVDRNNNRVLIWNSIPTSNNQAADVVLGQPDFYTVNYNAADNSSFNDPHGVLCVGTKVFVADTYNNRILVWNTIPTTNNQAADYVLGQPDFTSTNSGGDADTVYDLASNGTILVAVGNQMTPRFWNTIPTTTNQAPSFDLGSEAMSTIYWNGVSSVTIAGTKLVITGDNSSGTFLWNSIPTSAATYAAFEVGTHNGATPTATNFLNSYHVYSDGTRLVLTDDNRVLIWNSLPTTGATAPNVVLGQATMTTNDVNGVPLTATSMTYPSGLVFIGSKLAISDGYSRRVLIWNSTPTTNAQAANVVIGQADKTSKVWDTTSSIMKWPYGLATDGTRLIVADGASNRVLIWNTVPTSDGQPADVVIGQPNMTSYSSGTSATELNWPTGVATDGTRLAVADSGNSRVLIWNTIPTSNGQAANVVVGQADMTSSNTGTSATELMYAEGVTIAGSKLIVSDSGNNRTLIWNTIPSTDGAAANVVVGQPDFTTASIGVTNSKFGNYGALIAIDSNNRMYASDNSNHRILIWNTIPTTNGAAANAVIGQSNFTSRSAGESSSKFNFPWGITIHDSALWIADTSNARVIKITP